MEKPGAEKPVMEKRDELYRGKAKTVYATDDPHLLVMHYRDDVSAFDGAKLAKLDGKGETNNRINAYVMGSTRMWSSLHKGSCSASLLRKNSKIGSGNFSPSTIP